jgi:hypothetical protein
MWNFRFFQLLRFILWYNRPSLIQLRLIRMFDNPWSKYEKCCSQLSANF